MVLSERRVAKRKAVNLSVLYRTGLRKTQATVVDISITGARLESALAIPPPGAVVRIELASLAAHDCLAVTARVVRYTARGFAVEFTEIDDELRKLIEEIDS